MATSVFGTQCIQTDHILCKATTWIWRIAPVICIAVGTFGNIINIIILLRKNLRSKPCFILIFVAIADLICLWTVPLADLFRFGYGMPLETVSYSLCVANILAGYIFAAVSLWMLAAFAIGRLLFVLLPHRSNIHLNSRKSIVFFICTIVSISILIIAPILVKEIVYGAQGNKTTDMNLKNSISCQIMAFENDSTERLFGIIWVAVGLVVPVLIILFGNCVLVYKLCRRPNQSEADNAQINLLFAVSGLLLATLLPYGIFYYTLQVIEGQTDIKAPIFGLIHVIVETLASCNYALNFFLYLWKSSIFKVEFNAFVNELKSRLCRREKVSCDP